MRKIGCIEDPLITVTGLAWLICKHKYQNVSVLEIVLQVSHRRLIVSLCKISHPRKCSRPGWMALWAIWFSRSCPCPWQWKGNMWSWFYNSVISDLCPTALFTVPLQQPVWAYLVFSVEDMLGVETVKTDKAYETTE